MWPMGCEYRLFLFPLAQREQGRNVWNKDESNSLNNQSNKVEDGTSVSSSGKGESSHTYVLLFL